MAHGQRTRYDYRNDYKNLNLEELKEQADKTLDRMLGLLGLDNRAAHDFARRNSYIKQLIIKMETKKSVKNKIEALVIDNKIKDAIIYAQSKGVTAEEFGRIAGKYWKL